MALHDTKHSNVRRTRRKQKGVRRERLNFTDDDDGALAMINVWLVLNDAPPRNQLVFCACDAADAIPSASEHMLHAGVSTDEVAYGWRVLTLPSAVMSYLTSPR